MDPLFAPLGKGELDNISYPRDNLSAKETHLSNHPSLPTHYGWGELAGKKLQGGIGFLLQNCLEVAIREICTSITCSESSAPIVPALKAKDQVLATANLLIKSYAHRAVS